MAGPGLIRGGARPPSRRREARAAAEEARRAALERIMATPAGQQKLLTGPGPAQTIWLDREAVREP